MNVFRDLYDECNTGSARSKDAFLGQYPRIIDIELTNACNFGCVFCPTGNRAMERKTGLMSTDTLLNAMDKIRKAVDGGYKIGVRFIGWGEPLMHPDLLLAIGMGKLAMPTHVNTNGSFLDTDIGYSSEKLIRAGLHSIKFSLQGTDRQTYGEARQIDFYDQLFEKVKHFRKVRDELHPPTKTRGVGLPWIGVSTSTTYETEESLRAFVTKWSVVADEISLGKTVMTFFDHNKVKSRLGGRVAFKKLAREATTSLRHPDPCPEVWDKLTIAWDGTGRVCCNDFDGTTNLGNINDHGLRAMWTHPTIKAYRERLAQREYTGPLCSVCYDYQGNTKGGR